MRLRTSFFAALIGGLSTGASAADDPAFGHWLIESGRAIVKVDACGDSACATIVWLIEPRQDNGAPIVDLNNQDPALRDRPVCGLSLASGFAKDGPGEWSGGEIYNGEDGETYSANMSIEADGRLRLRGYVGLPILGKTQHWTRVDGDRGGCPLE